MVGTTCLVKRNHLALVYSDGEVRPSPPVTHSFLTVFFPVPGETVNTNLEVLINMTLLTFHPQYMHGALLLLNG